MPISNGQRSGHRAAKHCGLTVAVSILTADHNRAAPGGRLPLKQRGPPKQRAANPDLASADPGGHHREGRALSLASEPIHVVGKLAGTAFDFSVTAIALENLGPWSDEHRPKAQPDHQTGSGEDADPPPGSKHQSIKKSGRSDWPGSTAY